METRRQKNAKIKKYFADYQHGFKKSLKKKKVQGINIRIFIVAINFFSEEKMLKQIFEEGLAIQKTRLRELRTQAQGKITVFIKIPVFGVATVVINFDRIIFH